MKRNFLYFGLLLSLTLGATAHKAAARPTEGSDQRASAQRRAALLKTAAGCRDAEATIDLDINNVRARIMTGGDMWWDRGTGEARYEIPKGSRKNSLFAGSLWVGGYDTQGQLKVAAQTFRQSGNDYWTGPMDANNAIDEATCTSWDRFWKVNLSDVEVFRDLIRRNQAGTVESSPVYASIREWPAYGNIDAVGSDGASITADMLAGRQYAPFIDIDGDGLYEWEDGDYPKIDVNDQCKTVLPNPDQFIFSIYNDVGDTKTQTGSDGIGLEVQRTAFAFSTKDFLNDATFYNYRLINRGALTLDSCHTATFSDADLGFATDDYIGCDTARGLGILYNATGTDGTSGQVNAYGSQVPMVGVDFFIGPKRFFTDVNGNDSTVKLKMSKFTYFNNGTGLPELQDPRTAIEFFRYMTGSNRSGNPFVNDFAGSCGSGQSDGAGTGPTINFVFTGDPGVPGTWSECCANNAPGDRRFIHSAGPFRLTGGGVTNDITIGICWVNNAGGCPSTSFRKIRVADDAIQELFDNCFATIEGPHAPRVSIREMNRQLVFNLFNDSASNNFLEAYGSRTIPTRIAFSLFPDRDSIIAQFGVDATQRDLREQYISRFLVSTSKSRNSADSFYDFEGYRVFQLRDALITPAQIFDERGELNEEVAKEVFQSDLRNEIGTLENPIVNFALRTEIIPQRWQSQLKVRGKDSGVRRAFTITEDAFATGLDKTLVNYKTYRYVVVAYGYNNFATFNEDSAETTQDRAYIESAKYADGKRLLPLRVWEAMPNPANGDMGTTLNAGFGDGVQIQRFEGIGNGGNVVDMETESENEAMVPPHISLAPKFRRGAGPVSVRVVDPLKVVGAKWELRISGPLRANERGINPDSGRWVLIRDPDGVREMIYSERDLSQPNEQILESYGISVTVAQAENPGVLTTQGNGYLTSDVTYEDRTKAWLSGVQDEEDINNRNWIRSGDFTKVPATGNPLDPFNCNYDDKGGVDPQQDFENMLANNTLTAATWAPYALTPLENKTTCGFGMAAQFGVKNSLEDLRSVDVVFTADKSKWSRCMVVEMQDTAFFSQGNAAKHTLRRARGWGLDKAMSGGQPVYSTAASDSGMSWFPGYAIDQETGERLNIFFSEDSYQAGNNGRDMLWNPTQNLFDFFGNPTFGGKHYIFVQKRRYDSCRSNLVDLPNTIRRGRVYQDVMWFGTSMPRTGIQLASLENGTIPTTTRLRFRVTRPYATFKSDPNRTPVVNNDQPLFRFSTEGMAPSQYNENSGRAAGLLDSIYAVPNPYYGYAGYEQNRLDTRVRIIRLPRTATISIYSLDGSLVRRLTKDDPNVSYIDWDLRNARGLPVASGMYLIHVNATGIGETVIKWFGAMRPVDVTNF